MKKLFAILTLVLTTVSCAHADTDLYSDTYTQEEWDGNWQFTTIDLEQQSTDPRVPDTGRLKLYAKDSSGTLALFTRDSLGNVTEVGSGGGGGGSGDVTGVGDCTNGACLDGTSDGGTYVRLYDSNSHYGQLAMPDISANKTYTLPDSTGTLATLAGTETLTNKTLAAASNVIEADTATALTANGSNCSAGSGALGVDASGAAESCTDFEEDLSNSAGLLAALSDETGTGVAVFSTSPTLVTPILGVATATTINTGQGNNLLYDMDQNVQTTNSVTFATVDTGEGANELFDMDQNVATTSTVTFATVSVNTEVYDATGWNGDLSVPTKDAVRDKIETISAGTGPFTESGDMVYLTTGTQNTTFGSSTRLGKVGIDGDVDTETTIVVQAASANQSAKLAIFEQADGTDVVTIATDGSVVVTGTGTAEASFGSASQATYTTTYVMSSAPFTMRASAGKATYSSALEATSVTVTTDAYDATNWNGDTRVPTKDAVRDKIETLGAGSTPDREIIWPASATLPLEAADSIPPIAKDAGTNFDQLVVDFDADADECRQVDFDVPADIDTAGTVTFTAKWYSAATTTGNIIWDFRHNSGVAEGADPDQVATTETAAADAVQGTAGQITVTTWTETVSNLGWAAGDSVSGVFCRDANNGSDTLANDARAKTFQIRIPRA